MQLFTLLKDILAPKKCYSCKTEGTFLCKKCLEQLGYFESICPICKQKSQNYGVHFYCKNSSVYFEKMMILTHYQHRAIKKLIHDAKFYHRKDILEDIAFYLGDLLFKNISESKDEIILVPSPMYFWKKIARGYNQSEILAKNISVKYQILQNTNILKKLKKTKQQSHLTRTQRKENLLGAIGVNNEVAKNFQDKTFIIIDDVVSTGSTLNECARLLKQTGVNKIYGLVIASD